MTRRGLGAHDSSAGGHRMLAGHPNISIQVRRPRGHELRVWAGDADRAVVCMWMKPPEWMEP